MLPTTTFGISINRGWRDAYESIWRPEAFAQWAAGLARANLRRDGGVWKADGPQGPIVIRFSDHNEFGVMDHWVEAGDGVEISVPLRVIANGDGCEVLITLFRLPLMDDAMFAADAAAMKRDLAALKSSLER
ncbi:MAG: polyketide cyclase [Rhizobiales bacterium 65-9]|nr:polyketide cyclase [Hyphomicrobiales bacterium]OJY36441.1 MAG: polyketide cyclase [Rhizobiales bacterium 65-9]